MNKRLRIDERVTAVPFHMAAVVVSYPTSTVVIIGTSSNA